MQENDVTADHEEESNQTPAFDAPHSSDERTWAALAHASTLLNMATGMGGLIAAAVIWLTQKEKSAWVAFHGLQSLVFQAAQSLIVFLVVGVVWVVGFAFSFITIGFGAIVAVPVMIVTMFLGIAFMMAGTVYALYGAYRVYEGHEFRYIWIGDWVYRRSFK
jgi:uncharacterized Tic20 family protein